MVDNCDYNINNLTERSTFHYIGCIIIVTPGFKVEIDNIERLQTLPSEVEVKNSNHIKFFDYNVTPGKGLGKVEYRTRNRRISLKPSIVTKFNVLWLFEKHNTVDFLGWNGFIERLPDSYSYETSQIMFGPFIYRNPSDYRTIFTTIKRLVVKAKFLRMKTCFITFRLSSLHEMSKYFGDTIDPDVPKSYSSLRRISCFIIIHGVNWLYNERKWY